MFKRIISMILVVTLIISILPYKKAEAIGIEEPEIQDNWVQSSYPKNNQGTIDGEKVERNPLIEINFKYDVDLIDKSKISISSDGDIYAVDINKDAWINYDGNTLKIETNSLYESGRNPLRANTAYKIIIGKGALRLQNHEEMPAETKIYNNEIVLYFITGEGFIIKDRGLEVVKYTSSEDITHDNISSYSSSKLEKDGSIYIHLNREIKWNQWTSNPKIKTDEEALEHFKLYKIPKAFKEAKNSLEETYDSEFRYDKDKDNLPLGINEEVEIESVEIVKDINGKRRVIKVTPKEELLAFNKYHINLTKGDIVTDDFEKLLRANINQTIWTMADDEETAPKWLMDNITPEEIIENDKGPKKSYTIHGAPNYNEHIDKENGKPIILFVDREVIVNPKLINPLSNVTLYEGYGEHDISSGDRPIKWYEIEHFYERGLKKTKISLYPEGELHSGRYYKLDIKENAFKSRSDKSLEAIELNFVIEGKSTSNKVINKFDIINKNDFIQSGDDIPFIVSDFGPAKNNMEINITGYNFTENISKVRFVRDSDGKVIEIPKDHLGFVDVTKITGTIKDSVKKEFNKNTSAGVYKVYIDFLDGTIAGEGRFSVRHNRPEVKRTIPVDEDRYFDPEDLYERFPVTGEDDEEGYYLQVVFDNIGFKDIDRPLRLIDLNIDLNKLSLTVEGDTNNLVDGTRTLQYKNNSSAGLAGEFTVYIPIIEKLMENQKYNAAILEDSLVYYNNMDKETTGNLSYKWSFNTNYVPKAERLYEGSLPEYYDERYPIVIDGAMFHSDTSVVFRDMRGDTYRANSVTMKDSDTLYVYLPRRPRLDIGQYDIIIRNGRSHETDMVYGILSIVEEGRYIPNEDYRIKDENSKETVKEIIATSKNIIELGSRQREKNYVKIDLDDLVGTDSWVRSIEYPSGRGDSINELELKSKWANTIIRNLELDRSADDRYIELRAGRVEPSMGDILKKKLRGRNIKSDFIEISGENFKFTSISVEIPYIQSDGIGLKMLRYDEERRNFEDLPYSIDLVDGKLRGTSDKPGIFVIVK